MRRSVVKRKLKNNEPVLAAKMNFLNPHLAEMMGLIGFDCLWICNEHIYIDNSLLDHIILASRSTGMDVLLRRNGSAYQELLQPLEMGVTGIMAPRIRTVRQVNDLIEWIKFPPLGRRGFDGVNADADFGLISMDEYIRTANSETFTVVQIEDPEAIDLVDEIASLEGVDVLFIGHGDLALSLGVPGQTRHPRIVEIMDRVLEACARYGKHAGIPIGSPEEAESLIARGFRFFTIGADYRHIKAALLNMREEFRAVGFDFHRNADDSTR